MELYSQREGIEQAFASNKQARSASQLTKLATFIVPSTFVASIFSMNGSYAAGEQDFYLYWAISAPITVLLLTWVVIGQDLQDWLMKLGAAKWYGERKLQLQNAMQTKVESDNAESGSGRAQENGNCAV